MKAARTVVLAVLGCVLPLTTCISAASREERVLAAVLKETRLFELRTGFEGHDSCAVAEPGRWEVKKLFCSGARLSDRQLGRLSRLLQEAGSKESFTSELLKARVELILASEGQPVDPVIKQFTHLLQSNPDSVVLNELAIAHALRAAQRNTAEDIFRALDFIERAYHNKPAEKTVAFNRALLLERLHLGTEAAAAWDDYLKLDSRGDWSEEAHLRSERIGKIARLPDPQALRERAFGEQLPAWARFRLGGQSDSAALILRELERVGRQLGTGGEHTVTRVLDCIKARESSSNGLDSLARGLVKYSRGLIHYQSANFDGAVEPLEGAVLLLQRCSPALTFWPRFLLATISLYRGDQAGSALEYELLLTEVDAAVYPAAWARAQWALGITRYRQSRFDDALRAYSSAAAVFDRIGERENLGAIVMLLGELEARQGLRARSWRSFNQALQDLREKTGSVNRHNLLAILGRQLTESGFLHAAVMVLREDGAGVAQSGTAKDRAEALARQAQSEIGAGLRQEATQHLSQARAALSQVIDSAMHNFISAEITRTEADLYLDEEPARALPQLNEAIERFSRIHLSAADLAPMLARRGSAHLRTGDTTRARADLDSAIRLLEAAALDVNQKPTRAMMLETATRISDGLISLDLARSAPIAALGTLERTRAKAAQLGRTGSMYEKATEAASWEELRKNLPRNLALIEYALLPDRLVTWVLRQDTIIVLSRSSAQRHVEALVGRFETDLRSAYSNADIRASSAELSALLIEPARRLLAGVSEIVFVPDKVLRRVAFAALFDRQAGKFLVQQFALRFAASGREALKIAPSKASRSEIVLAVGDPAFDRTAFSDLPPLAGAAREAVMIARETNATVLRADAATSNEVIKALRSAEVFHFAGHARSGVDAPELSYLVMAGAGRNSVLYAADLREHRFPALRLVVLSACETAAATSNRIGALDDLTGAFMTAGAAGVVGTLWPVDDQAAVEFLPRFYRNRTSGMSNAQALRQMQMDMMSSEVARYAAPAAWASFRLQGL